MLRCHEEKLMRGRSDSGCPLRGKAASRLQHPFRCWQPREVHVRHDFNAALSRADLWGGALSSPAGTELVLLPPFEIASALHPLSLTVASEVQRHP